MNQSGFVRRFMALVRKEIPDAPLSFNNFRD